MPPPLKPLTDGIPKPKRLADVPRYLFLRVKGFFTRLFYIIRLVCETSPWILVLLAFLCLFDGILPIFGAYISRDLLNAIADLIANAPAHNATVWQDLFVTLRPVLFLFLAEFIFLFLSKVMARVNATVNAVAGELVVNHIKMKIMNKAKEVDQCSFDNPAFYEKLENANREAGMRPIAILTSTFNIISAMISAVSFVVVLATLSPLAPVLIVIASIPGAVVNYYYRNRSFQYLRRHSKERRQMNYYAGVMTNKDLAKEVRILDLGDTFIEKYRKVFVKYYAGLKRLTVKEGVSAVVVGAISTVATCLLFAYVAYTVVFGEGQIGDYSLYVGALTSISGYVTTLINSTATVYEGTLFIENMIDFMNEPVSLVPTADPPALPEKNGGHTIEFCDVCFRYPGSDHDVIKKVNLTLKSGESVVLVGLNGAGKTTLLKLMMRLYDATSGVILLDGKDIRTYDLKALYDLYGIIFQDFGRYSDSVRENVRFGDVNREENFDDIRDAAERANADGFIAKLPKTWETPLTRIFEEEGLELSGGQWQKLSVARAFYKESAILILDEPTASLDALAEQEIFRQFRALAEGKISVFVSHRLSAATTAGKIVVLQNGEVIEQGTHEELMRKEGSYYLLFSTQAKNYIS